MFITYFSMVNWSEITVETKCLDSSLKRRNCSISSKNITRLRLIPCTRWICQNNFKTLNFVHVQKKFVSGLRIKLLWYQFKSCQMVSTWKCNVINLHPNKHEKDLLVFIANWIITNSPKYNVVQLFNKYCCMLKTPTLLSYHP